jgi:hypothetical protein
VTEISTTGLLWERRSARALPRVRALPIVDVDRVAPPLAATVATCALVALLVERGRGLWFVADEWAFLVGRPEGLTGLLAPHNEHLVAVPALLLRVLAGAAGFEHLPYHVMAVAAHVGLVLVLVHVLRRLAVPAPVVWGTAALFALWGDIAEQLFPPLALSWLAPLAVVLLLAAPRPGASAAERRRFTPRLGILVGALAGLQLFGGTAIPLAVGCALALTLRGRPGAALIAAGPACALYAAWRLLFASGVPLVLDVEVLRGVAAYTAIGLGSAVARALTVPLAWGLVGAALALGGLVLARRRLPFVGLAAACSAVAFYALAGLARLGQAPVAQAGVHRYTFTGAFLLAVALLSLWPSPKPWDRRPRGPLRLATPALAGLLGILAVLGGVAGLRGLAAAEARGVRVEAALRTAVGLLDEGVPALRAAQPDAGDAPDVRMGDLSSMRAAGLFAATASGPVSLPVERVQRLRLQVALVRPEPVTALLQPEVGMLDARGCRRTDADGPVELRLGVVRPGTFRVEADQRVPLRVTLQEPVVQRGVPAQIDDWGPGATALTAFVGPDRPAHLEVVRGFDVAEEPLVLGFPAGLHGAVCGATLTGG